MSIDRRSGERLRATAAGVILLGLAVMGCTPSPQASATSRVCVPSDVIALRVVVSVISAPSGATMDGFMHWHLYPGGGPVEDAGTYSFALPGVTTGAVLNVPARPDPGRCLFLSASAGVTYQATVVADPAATLLLALGLSPIDPNVLNGSLPGES